MERKRYDEDGVSYFLDYAPSFNSMLVDFRLLVDTAFQKAEDAGSASIPRYWAPLRAALAEIVTPEDRHSDGSDKAYARLGSIVEELRNLLSNLSALCYYAEDAEFKSRPLTDPSHYYVEAFSTHIRNLKKITKKRLTGQESRLCEDREAVEVLLTFGEDFHPDLTAALKERLAVSAPTPGVKPENTPEPPKTTPAQVKERLGSVSPDLAEAYQKTVSLADEASGLDSLTVEDEYFLEQLHADYVPRILDAVDAVRESSAGFEDREAVVSEVLKQFRVIQAGVQRIIDAGIARKISEIRMQTDFLTHKILGESSLTLDIGEAGASLQAAADEADRIRDNLYRKHVAPILQANKEEHARALQAEITACQGQLEAEKSRLTDQFNQQLSVFKAQVAELNEVNAAYERTLIENDLPLLSRANDEHALSTKERNQRRAALPYGSQL